MQDVRNIQFKLYQLGYLKSTGVDGSYGPITTSAVKKFQTDNKLVATGKADAKTLAKLTEMTTKYQSDYDGGSGQATPSDPDRGDSSYGYTEEEELTYNAFFDKKKIFRKANIPIRIEYGPNRDVKKTITNVFFRSLGQQLDGSGNPIYDTLEFIGRDIIEEE